MKKEWKAWAVVGRNTGGLIYVTITRYDARRRRDDPRLRDLFRVIPVRIVTTTQKERKR